MIDEELLGAGPSIIIPLLLDVRPAISVAVSHLHAPTLCEVLIAVRTPSQNVLKLAAKTRCPSSHSHRPDTKICIVSYIHYVYFRQQ